jgi:thymidylate synthase
MVKQLGFVTENATEAFEMVYKELTNQAKEGFKQPSRAGNIVGEIVNAVVCIHNPYDNIVTLDTRNMPVKYAIGELLWYLSGTNKLDAILPYSKFWKNISDDNVTVNSAYGYRIFEKFGFDQWEHVKELLKKDPYSRQAVIHIKDADNKPTKDTPCTVSLQFQIREDKLYCTTYMRSNDIWLGFPYDVFSFTCLQIKMAMELGVGLGSYTHVAGSLHLYERNWDSKEEDNCVDGLG